MAVDLETMPAIDLDREIRRRRRISKDAEAVMLQTGDWRDRADSHTATRAFLHALHVRARRYGTPMYVG